MYRLAVFLIPLVALMFTAAQLLFEIELRKEDRAVLHASMLAQVAQAIALPKDIGLVAVSRSVEQLSREGVSMRGIYLRRVKLSSADLSGADFAFADFGEANLRRTRFEEADLFGANFVGASLLWANLKDAILADANFTGVNFSSANFSGANFTNTNITDANLSKARNLTQQQLNVACAEEGKPPRIHPRLTWNARDCAPFVLSMIGGIYVPVYPEGSDGAEVK